MVSIPVLPALAFLTVLAVSSAALTSAGLVNPLIAARRQAPNAEDLIARLDAFETQWVAGVQLQQMPDAALEGLLRPGRIASTAPHGRWTAQMLALAKLGPRAIPAIRARSLALLGDASPQTHVTVDPLIQVLESIGPAAVPVLVDIAEGTKTSTVTMAALESIIRLEPRREVFGQQLSPWAFWRPLDDRATELARTLPPLMPRVQRMMERAAAEWTPRQSPQPQRPAAYLLARWGSGDLRARGVALLQDLATQTASFHDALEAIRLLHALQAARTEELIRAAATRVPDYGNLKGTYLLQLAVALHQLGDRSYGPLLIAAARDPRPEVRMEVAQFVAMSGHVDHAGLLSPLLTDDTAWDGRTVAEVAHESLRRLTLEQLPADAASWQRWSEQHKEVERGSLLASWIAARSGSIARVPLAEADGWLRQLNASDGVAAFPLIDAYLRRTDLDGWGIRISGGPAGMDGPDVISLLLAMLQRAVPGARERLEQCLTSASGQVRVYAALAIAAYDRARAIERLAIELTLPDGGDRNAGVFLLQLGDPRGFAERLERLGSNHWAIRQLACRDLRFYSQQTLSCDVGDAAPDRAANIAAWRAWWARDATTTRVKVHDAELDSRVFPLISPISVGDRQVR